MRYVYSKLRWRLSIYDISQTWVVRNLDDKVIRYTKDWLHFHQGANLGHIKLSINKFGFGFQLPSSNISSNIFKFCKLSMRVILKKSKNKEIRALFKTTSTSNIAIDSVIVNNEDNPNLALKHQIENNVLEHLAGLTEQNAVMQHMKMEATSKQISTRKQVCDRLPTNIFVFIRRALIFSLLNNSNLHRWGKIDSAACDLCSLRQTQCHMLANCPVAADEGRYTWRHDSVLNTILMYFMVICQVIFILTHFSDQCAQILYSQRTMISI